MNRGHLISYQFSGLNDEGKNLVPMTAWLNSGALKGTDHTNPDSMLFYEKQLDTWLTENPNYWLDYKVTPIYVDDELLPRQIELQYVGLDQDGNLISVLLGGKETLDQSGVTHVLLDNSSPNAEIDYKTGAAKNTMDKNSTPVSTSSSTVTKFSSETSTTEATTANTDQERTVYVARNGKAEAYWYSMDNMPSNTNFDRVITMTEAQALQAGKHHSSRE